MTSDEQFMRRALDLARAGIGFVSPNPAVGAVVIDANGNEAGVGTHTYDGVKHAEVLAIEQAGENTRGASLYLTLSHAATKVAPPPASMPSSPPGSHGSSSRWKIPILWSAGGASNGCGRRESLWT